MESFLSMKKVRSVKILGQNIKVKWSKKQLIDHQGRILSGFYEPAKRLIVIHDSGDKRDMEICFYHECSHAIMFISGIAQIVTGEAQEIISENFAHFIYDLKK